MPPARSAGPSDSGTVNRRRYQLNDSRPWPRRASSVPGAIVSHPLSSKPGWLHPCCSRLASYQSPAARAPELRPIWFVIMMFALGIAPYLVFLKIYLLARPELGSMTTFYSTYAISAVLLRALFSWMPERYGLIRVLIPSMVTSAAM